MGDRDPGSGKNLDPGVTKAPDSGSVSGKQVKSDNVDSNEGLYNVVD
jgi:hypothetical protein